MTRISTETLYQRGVSAMLTQQAEVGKTQEQISLGKRILSPSDDPAGSVRILDLNRAIDIANQYNENSGRAQNRLEVEESTLRSISNILPRVIELTIQGGSDTYSAEQRGFMATEVRQILGQLLDLANTRDSNGEYIFSGFQGRVRPFDDLGGGTYAYNGDMGLRDIQISADRKVADSDNGFSVFMDVPISAGGERNIFETLDLIATNLEANTSPTVYSDDLNLILTHVAGVRATVGSRLLTIDKQIEINDDFILTMETSRSDLEDLDYAEAITRFNKQQVALEAAQKSFSQIQGLTLFNFIR
jgi:flagellar hook-associated protein 3 FlgL